MNEKYDGAVDELPYVTKSDFAYMRLRSAILSGQYAPGAPLNQALLAQSIGISTTPLREALRKLSAEGLVELESHRDAYVTQLTAEESRDLLEMRLALDPLAISLAAERRSRDDIRVMRAAQEEMESRPCGAAVVDPGAHREFHAAMYRASHNELLVSTLDSLWDKAERYRLHGMMAVRGDEDVAVKRQRKSADHAAILDCIIRGDGGQAAELMRRHIVKSLEARAATSLSAGASPMDQDTNTGSVTVSGA